MTADDDVSLASWGSRVGGSDWNATRNVPPRRGWAAVGSATTRTRDSRVTRLSARLNRRIGDTSLLFTEWSAGGAGAAAPAAGAAAERSAWRGHPAPSRTAQPAPRPTPARVGGARSAPAGSPARRDGPPATGGGRRAARREPLPRGTPGDAGRAGAARDGSRAGSRARACRRRGDSGRRPGWSR